jgi:outer membrane protein assembly factor BamA
VTLVIENNLVASPTEPGKLIEVKHSRYFINRVFINPNYDPVFSRRMQFDTLRQEVHQLQKDSPADYYYFLHQGKIKVNPKTITQSIFIEDNEPYSLKDVQQTYRRLGGISAFDYKSIQFTEVQRDTMIFDSTDKFLRCNINLSRSQLMSYTLEAEGTNRGGDLGMGASLTYLNKNIFRGGELLRIKLKGGLEAQKLSGEESQEKNFLFFNTWETGLEASILFPKFMIFIRQEKFPKYFRPFTTFSTGINFQQRPQYFRGIATVTYGYSWSESDFKEHQLNPIEVSLVKVNPTDEFANELEELQDERLKNQYSDHLTLGLRYTFTFNNQDIRKLKNFIFLRANLETSGNLLYAIDNMVDAPKNDEGTYTLFNIKYSQYIKNDYDFRYYFVFNRVNMLVLRSMLGIGVPYGNTPRTLPFEQGFYLGGANSLRGWRFRSVGPGSYSAESDYVDKMGEIMLEGNIEYRFPIYKSFKGAVFSDIGNVWLMKPDSVFPGGNFEFKNFLSELAINAGLGLRFDFSFFVFRIDAAIRWRDPALPPDERWVIGDPKLRDVVWNFGIGYPF